MSVPRSYSLDDIIANGNELVLSKWPGSAKSLHEAIIASATVSLKNKDPSSSSSSAQQNNKQPMIINLSIDKPQKDQKFDEENTLLCFLDIIQFAPNYEIKEIKLASHSWSSFTPRTFRLGLEITRVRNLMILQQKSEANDATKIFNFFDQFFNLLRSTISCPSTSDEGDDDNNNNETEDLELSLASSSAPFLKNSPASFVELLNLLNALLKHASLDDTPYFPYEITSIDISLPSSSSEDNNNQDPSTVVTALTNFFQSDFDFTRLSNLESLSFEGLNTLPNPSFFFEMIIRRFLRHKAILNGNSVSLRNNGNTNNTLSYLAGSDFASSVQSRSQIDKRQKLLLQHQQQQDPSASVSVLSSSLSSFTKYISVQNLDLRSCFPMKQQQQQERASFIRLLSSFCLERDNISLVSLDLRENSLSIDELLIIARSALFHPNVKEIHYDDAKGPLILDMSQGLRNSLRRGLLFGADQSSSRNLFSSSSLSSSSSSHQLIWDLDSSSSSSSYSSSPSRRATSASLSSASKTSREGAETAIKLLFLSLEKLFERKLKLFANNNNKTPPVHNTIIINLRGYSFNWNDALLIINFLNKQAENCFEDYRKILATKKGTQSDLGTLDEINNNIAKGLHQDIIGSFRISFSRLSSCEKSDFSLLSDLATAITRKQKDQPHNTAPDVASLCFSNYCLESLHLDDLVKRSIQKLQHDERSSGERSITSPLATWPLLPLIDQQVWRIIRSCHNLSDFDFYPLPASFSVMLSEENDEQHDFSGLTSIGSASYHQQQQHDEPLENEFVGYYTPPRENSPRNISTTSSSQSPSTFQLEEVRKNAENDNKEGESQELLPSPLPRHLDPNLRALHLRKLQHNIKALLFSKSENMTLYLKFLDVICEGMKNNMKEIVFENDSEKKEFVSDRLLSAFRSLVLGSELFSVIQQIRFVFHSSPHVASLNDSPPRSSSSRRNNNGNENNNNNKNEKNHELSRNGINDLFRCLKGCTNLSTLDVGETSKFVVSDSQNSHNNNNPRNNEWVTALLNHALHLAETSSVAARTTTSSSSSDNHHQHENKRLVILNDGAEVVPVDSHQQQQDEKEALAAFHFNKELDSLLGKLKGAELEKFGTPMFRALLPLAECDRDRITSILQQTESERQQPEAVKVVLQQQQQQLAIASNGATANQHSFGFARNNNNNNNSNPNRRGSNILGVDANTAKSVNAMEAAKEKEKDSNSFILDSPSNIFGPPPHIHGILRYPELAELLFNRWSIHATARWRTLALPHCAIGNKGAELVFKFLDEGGRSCPALRIRKLDLKNNDLVFDVKLMKKMIVAVQSAGITHVDCRGNEFASSEQETACVELLHDIITSQRALSTLTSLVLPVAAVSSSSSSSSSSSTQSKLWNEIKRVLSINQHTSLRARVAEALRGKSSTLELPSSCGDSVFDCVAQDFLSLCKSSSATSTSTTLLQKIILRSCRLTDKSLPVLEKLCIACGGKSLQTLDCSLNNFTPSLLLQTLANILNTLQSRYEDGGSLRFINLSSSSNSASNKSSSDNNIINSFVAAVENQHEKQSEKHKNNQEQEQGGGQSSDDDIFEASGIHGGVEEENPSSPKNKKNTFLFAVIVDGWSNFFDKDTNKALSKLMTNNNRTSGDDIAEDPLSSSDITPIFSVQNQVLTVRSQISSLESLSKLTDIISNQFDSENIKKLDFAGGVSSFLSDNNNNEKAEDAQDRWEDLFDSVLKHCPNLEYFGASDCGWNANIFKAFLESFVSANASLTHIDLSDNTKLFDVNNNDSSSSSELRSTTDENKNIFGILIRVLASENANLRFFDLINSLPSQYQNYDDLVRKILSWNSLGSSSAFSAIIKKDLLWIEQDIIFSCVRDVCKIVPPSDSIPAPPTWFQTLFPKIGSIAPYPINNKQKGAQNDNMMAASNPFASMNGNPAGDSTTIISNNTNNDSNNNNNTAPSSAVQPPPASIYSQISWPKGIATDAAVTALCQSLRLAFERMNSSFIPSSVLYQYQQQIDKSTTTSSSTSNKLSTVTEGTSPGANEQFSVGRPRRRKMMFSEGGEDGGGGGGVVVENVLDSSSGGPQSPTTAFQEPSPPVMSTLDGSSKTASLNNHQKVATPKEIAQDRARKLTQDSTFFPFALLDLSNNRESLSKNSIRMIYTLLSDLFQEVKSHLPSQHNSFRSPHHVVSTITTSSITPVPPYNSRRHSKSMVNNSSPSDTSPINNNNNNNSSNSPYSQHLERQPSPPLTAKTDAHSPNRGYRNNASADNLSQNNNNNNNGSINVSGNINNNIPSRPNSASIMSASRNNNNGTVENSGIGAAPFLRLGGSHENNILASKPKFSLFRHICLDGCTKIFDDFDQQEDNNNNQNESNSATVDPVETQSDTTTSTEDLLVRLMLSNPHMTISFQNCTTSIDTSQLEYLALCNAQPTTIRSLLLVEEEFLGALTKKKILKNSGNNNTSNNSNNNNSNTLPALITMPTSMIYFPLSAEGSINKANSNNRKRNDAWKVNDASSAAAESPSTTSGHRVSPSLHAQNQQHLSDSDPLQDDACSLLRQVFLKVARMNNHHHHASSSSAPSPTTGSISPSLSSSSSIVNSNILHLKLPRNEITANGCIDLIDGLCALPANQLITLDLSDNRIGDAAARPLMGKLILKHCKHSIKTVNFAGNYFGGGNGSGDERSTAASSVDIFIAGLEELREQKKQLLKKNSNNKNSSNSSSSIVLDTFDVSGCTGLTDDQSASIALAAKLLQHTDSSSSASSSSSLIDLCSSIFEGCHSINAPDFTRMVNNSHSKHQQQLLPLFLSCGVVSQAFTTMKSLDLSKLSELKDSDLGWQFSSNSHHQNSHQSRNTGPTSLVGVFCDDEDDNATTSSSQQNNKQNNNHNHNDSSSNNKGMIVTAPPCLPVLQYTSSTHYQNRSWTHDFSSLLNTVLTLSPQLTSLDLSYTRGLSLPAVLKIFSEVAPFVSEAKLDHIGEMLLGGNTNINDNNNSTSSSSSELSESWTEFIVGVCEITSTFAGSNGLKCTIGPFSSENVCRDALAKYDQGSMLEVFVSLRLKGNLELIVSTSE